VDVEELNLTVHVGDRFGGRLVHDAQARRAGAASFVEGDEDADLRVVPREVDATDIVEDADERLLVGEFVLDDLVANDNRQTGPRWRVSGHWRTV